MADRRDRLFAAEVLRIEALRRVEQRANDVAKARLHTEAERLEAVAEDLERGD